MSDINSVALTGRITRDAEVRQTQGGSVVVTAGLAVADYRKDAVDASGKVTNEYVNFFDLTMFGERYSKLAPYITKGRQVTVQGRLHWSSWEKDGERRSKVDVTVLDLVLGQQPRGQEDGAQQAYQPPQNAQQAYDQVSVYGKFMTYGQQPAPQAEMYDSEIPF